MVAVDRRQHANVESITELKTLFSFENFKEINQRRGILRLRLVEHNIGESSGTTRKGGTR